MITLEDLKNLQAFMNRVDLKGTEVPTWAQCWNALAKEIERIQQEAKA